MTSKQSREAREISVELVKDNPEHLKRYFKQDFQRQLTEFADAEVETFTMPGHHPVLYIDLTEIAKLEKKEKINAIKRLQKVSSVTLR